MEEHLISCCSAQKLMQWRRLFAKMPPTQRELDNAYRIYKSRENSARLQQFIKLACYIVVGLTIVYTARSLAGKQTLADLRFAVVADLKANRGFSLIASWLLTAGSTIWAVGENRLRRRNIKRMGDQLADLQKRINPERKSSRLMSDGTTRPEA